MAEKSENKQKKPEEPAPKRACATVPVVEIPTPPVCSRAPMPPPAALPASSKPFWAIFHPPDRCEPCRKNDADFCYVYRDKVSCANCSWRKIKCIDSPNVRKGLKEGE